MSVALSYGNNIICFGNVAISAGVLTPPEPQKVLVTVTGVSGPNNGFNHGFEGMDHDGSPDKYYPYLMLSGYKAYGTGEISGLSAYMYQTTSPTGATMLNFTQNADGGFSVQNYETQPDNNGMKVGSNIYFACSAYLPSTGTSVTYRFKNYGYSIWSWDESWAPGSFYITFSA